MTLAIDFQFYEVRPGCRIIGRNCGAEVTLGTVFTGLYRRDFPVRASGEDALDPGSIFICDLSLRVIEIEMYRRQMEFLSSGCTGLLGLSGEGLDAASRLLSVAPARTYYSLCADHPSIRIVA